MAFLAQVSTQQVITKSISTLTLDVSTITGVVLGAVQPGDITSTIAGLGSIGFISTSQLLSTIDGLGSANYISSSQLFSTVAGLGTGGGGITSLPSTISSFSFLTSSIYASTVLTSTLLTQALTMSSLNSGPVPTQTAGENFMIASHWNDRSIWYSYDGTTWLLGSNTTAASYNWGLGYNGQYWLAGGEQGTLRSADGINWTKMDSSWTFGLAWNGSMWVRGQQGGGNGGYGYSYNGSNWSNSVNAGSIFGDAYGTVAWGNDKFVGTGSLGSFTMAYSYDGINWTGIPSVFTTRGIALAFTGSQWIAGGQGTYTLMTSPNGITWTSRTVSNIGTCRGIAWSGNVAVAVGSRTGSLASGQTAAYSFDGITWTAASSAVNDDAFDVTWNGTSFYMIGQRTVGGVSTDAIARSPDGITWTLVSTPATFATNIGGTIKRIASRFNLPRQGYNPYATLYRSNVNIGMVSTATAIKYTGINGQFNNTVLAEISTGGFSQELLMFKGSSTSDRVRIQTTGNFVVETGVSARLWNDTTVPTNSNLTPAFIVNTNSNVGIQTASPGATLDVVGTARATTLSSLAFYASSIVAPYVYTPQFFTF